MRHVPWHLLTKEEQERHLVERENRQIDLYNASLGPIERLFLGIKRRKILK